MADDLALATAPVQFRQKRFLPKIESEVRFLVPPSLLTEIVGRQKPSLITQSYLPERLIPSLIDRYQICDLVDYSQEFSIARIRATKASSGGASYELEFKAPKVVQGGRKLSRLILPAPISLCKDEFEDLKRDATEGTIIKHRYTKQGLLGSGSSAVRCYAEIDEFIAGGVPLKRLSRPFVTLDIELPDDNFTSYLVSGEHSFDFLDRCVDMTWVNSEICSPLSNRKVARQGLGNKQMKALSTLDHMLRKLADARDR